ncbi:predicted protein [Uncinocarpus reesii 1704]|uniref:Uncharacterized protein n=1 Tax=Uncinocarpus reesii (strain UAMH 1704) TaxID=336963 RepID=C4JIV3_UNCRE|nr:uncharacterized protein UREG_01560 [Uncinocarpus reesii 1704]EEP76711.1 predicted protein [Uncinocarpus reesii 1704]
MSLKDLYKAFLADPTEDLLSPNASLHYITTTTTLNGAVEITQHLFKQRSDIKKNAEDILNAVEGTNSLCVEIETTLRFSTSGGAYLPGLEENLLVDRVVTFPLIHIVNLDPNRKISQIRVYWDQGSLLKQVGVIGSYQGNWPLCDGPDQARVVSSSIAVAPKSEKDFKQDGINSQTPLSLLGLQDDQLRPQSGASGVALPATIPAKVHRGMANDSTKRENPVSTHNQTSGILEHFEFAEEPPRLTRPVKERTHFEFGEEPPRRTGPVKELSHFEFGEIPPSGMEPNNTVHPRSNKHISQWDFEDFSTPEKPRSKIRGQDVRHFAWGDEKSASPETPVQKSRTIFPRRDTETHIEFEADAPNPRENCRLTESMGVLRKGLGLYENNLYDETEQVGEEKGTKLAHSATNNTNRNKNFGSQWAISEEPQPNTGENANEPKHIAAGRMKAVKMMDASWDKYDETTNSLDNTAPFARPKRINRNANQPSWSLGDENP